MGTLKKFAPLVVPVASFLLTLGFWGYMMGNYFLALGVLVLLGVHEAGHYLAARFKQVAVSLPLFTPFGAIINMKQQPKHASDEAFIALAGPVLGTAASLIALALGKWLQLAVLDQAAFIGLMLNLFNLIPLSPLDGGRISMAVYRRLWVVGMAMVAVFLYFVGGQILTVMLITFILVNAFRDIGMRALHAEQEPAYFALKPLWRITYAVSYAGLAALLVWLATLPIYG